MSTITGGFAQGHQPLEATAKWEEATGKHHVASINRRMSGPIDVGSEAGRTITVATPQSRIFLDARDIPAVIRALAFAQENATAPIKCPNGCEGNARCSECPS